MKAILVIDFPNGYGDVDDNKAIVTLRNGKLGTSLGIYNVPLKPMPQRQNKDEEKSSLEYVYEADTLDEFQTRGTSYLYGHIDGWNACLDEITGEAAENKHGM